MPYPFPSEIKDCRAMVFVDGENFAIRYGSMLEGASPLRHVAFERNVYVWSHLLDLSRHVNVNTIRRHYYTSVSGDQSRRDQIHDALQAMNIQSPKVFHRTKDKGSKRVDISLSVDMLWHAQANNYDAAVLVAGDEDYVPLVEAVKAQGKQVFIWFVKSGLSPSLKRTADYFFDVGEILFNPDAERYQ